MSAVGSPDNSEESSKAKGASSISDPGALLLVLAGLIAFAIPHAIGDEYFWGFQLDLGSIRLPTPIHTHYMLYHLLFGSLGSLLLATGLSKVLGRGTALDSCMHFFRSIPEKTFLSLTVTGALLIPVGIRLLVLSGSPVTDDESSYQFMAELLASGRAYGESHPWKLFFDRGFMVNDGKVYSQYFLGWPLLMVPGVWLHIPGYMNAVYCALTLPALFYIVKEMMGPTAAKLAVLLFISSPMMVVGASTQLSHTSCLFLLAWCHYFMLRAKKESSPIWCHALFGLCFSLAFFNRPTSTLGIGLPLLAVWGVGLARNPRRQFAFIAWAIPTAIMAALFFFINWAQTGDALLVAYQRYQDYSVENGLRFSRFEIGSVMGVHNMDLSDTAGNLARLGIGLVRSNFAFFGWPVSFIWLAFAGWRNSTRLLWWMCLCFLTVHFPLTDGGIDSYGPVHYTELFWPVLLLSIAGIQQIWRWVQQATASGLFSYRALPAGMLVALFLSAVMVYAPGRTIALAQIADTTNRPGRFIEGAKLENAVVFQSRPLSPPCEGVYPPPARGHVGWPPTNDPDFSNSILWANHLSIDKDKKLMNRFFSDREGWILAWKSGCNPVLLNLRDLPSGSLPNGLMRTGEDRFERYNDAMSPDGSIPLSNAPAAQKETPP